ncbi:MAG: hypothetical protein ACYCV6_12295 [Steroidobacteraceae bacterium]
MLVYIHIATTLAVGTLAAGVVALLLLLVNASIMAKRTGQLSLLDARANGVIFIALILAFICAHGIVASRIAPLDYRRFALSLVPLTLLLGGGFAIGVAIRNATSAQLHTMSWVFFWVFMGIIVLRLLKLEPHPGLFHKPTFPFTETSHFVLALAPIFLYRCVTAPRQHRLAWVIFGFGLAVLLKSATMVAFAFGAAMLCRRLAIIIAATGIALVTGAATHLHYFTARAAISAHSSNLSALVYYQGWEFFWHALTISHGWGLGFQQLGVHPMHLAVSRLIQTLAGGKGLNTMGGSFVFSKLGSEFGVFGITLAIAYLYACVKSIATLRTTKTFEHDTFSRCVIVSFGVDLFIRGTGYFYGPAMLFLAAAYSLSPRYDLLRRGVSARARDILVLR